MAASLDETACRSCGARSRWSRSFCERVVVERVVSSMSASSTTVTRRAPSLISANGVHCPAARPSTAVKQISALPKLKSAARRAASARALRSIRALLEHDDEPERALLVLEEQALGMRRRGACARSASASATVNTGGCVASGARSRAHQRANSSVQPGISKALARRPIVRSARLPAEPGATVLGAHDPRASLAPAMLSGGRGCSSGVEHNLAKVGVEGSNPFARSNFPRNSWPSPAAPAPLQPYWRTHQKRQVKSKTAPRGAVLQDQAAAATRARTDSCVRRSASVDSDSCSRNCYGARWSASSCAAG